MKKIGIALSGQTGDIITATSILSYKDQLWGADAEITWLADERYYDVFKYNPYLKVKQFPHGWQISEHDKQTIYAERIAKDKAEGMPDWEDLSLAMTSDNTLNQENKHMFYSVAQFDECYFPAPWMIPAERRHGINYPNCSKKVFGIPMDAEWHPVLYWSDEERSEVDAFIKALPAGKVVLVETYAGSGQTKITHQMIERALGICKEQWGECNFIFLSHKYLNGAEEFPDFSNNYKCFNASKFTVRQCGLLGNYADLLLSVSSGVTCALSAHTIRHFPILQYCGSAVCGTKEIANGEMIQVFSDGKEPVEAEKEYYEQLNFLLNKYTK